MTEMKTCKEFCDHLSDYLDGEVGANDCRLIEEHLKRCPPCAHVYQSLKLTVDICCRGLSDDIPDTVRTRLKAFLRENCKP